MPFWQQQVSDYFTVALIWHFILEVLQWSCSFLDSVLFISWTTEIEMWMAARFYAGLHSGRFGCAESGGLLPCLIAGFAMRPSNLHQQPTYVFF